MTTPLTTTWKYRVGQAVFVGSGTRRRTISALVVNAYGRPRYKISGAYGDVAETDIKPIPDPPVSITWKLVPGQKVFINGDAVLWTITARVVGSDHKPAYTLQRPYNGVRGANTTRNVSENRLKPATW